MLLLKRRAIMSTNMEGFAASTVAWAFQENGLAMAHLLDSPDLQERGRLTMGLVQKLMSVQVSRNAVEIRWARSLVKRSASAVHINSTAKTAGFSFRLRVTCNSRRFTVEQVTESGGQILRSLETQTPWHWGSAMEQVTAAFSLTRPECCRTSLIHIAP